MKKILFYLAVAGWLVSFTAHLLALQDIDVTEKAPFIWILHIGVFVVWFPLVFDLKKNEELNAYRQSERRNLMSSFGALKIIFKYTPAWMAVIAIGGFFYAFINFALFLHSQDGVPGVEDGKYILRNKHQVITEQAYRHYKANEVRGFSGHWLAFYGFAAAALFSSAFKQPDHF